MKIEFISFAVDFSQRIKEWSMLWTLAQIAVAKAIEFDSHSVRQLKQTAKDILGMQSDIH